MRHGIEAYYRQRERDERRLAAILAGVSFAALALSGLVLLHSALEYARTGRPPARQWPEFFGFEGREQYVRRIYLETAGPAGPRPGRPTVYFPSVTAQKGGRSPIASSDDPHARPETRRVGGRAAVVGSGGRGSAGLSPATGGGIAAADAAVTAVGDSSQARSPEPTSRARVATWL